MAKYICCKTESCCSGILHIAGKPMKKGTVIDLKPEHVLTRKWTRLKIIRKMTEEEIKKYEQDNEKK